jgi:hypothetical protein
MVQKTKQKNPRELNGTKHKVEKYSKIHIHFYLIHLYLHYKYNLTTL